MTTVAARLRQGVIEPLKRRFVGRDEVVDLIALALVAQEHLFLYGPPGTAKSALIREFAALVSGGYFEYLLTRFSEPNELFGPVDLNKLREGVVATNVTGMLPEAELAFLDELFNANSAILNNLLTVLNERVYRRGAVVHELPLLSLFSASNALPDTDALQALFDRFLLRCKVAPLARDAMPALLAAGWALEAHARPDHALTTRDLRELSDRVREVELAPVLELYADAVFKVRDLGVALSDRRAVKILRLVAASALLSDRAAAAPSDLWVLRYAWDREEQIAPLGALVDGILKPHRDAKDAHPLARGPARVEAEELARELAELEQAHAQAKGLVALARIEERLASVSDRAAWVPDETARKHLLDRAQSLHAKLDGGKRR